MYKDYFEAHQAEWEEAQEWLAYEADMVTNPYDWTCPTASDMEAMYTQSEARC